MGQKPPIYYCSACGCELDSCYVELGAKNFCYIENKPSIVVEDKPCKNQEQLKFSE